MFDNAVARLVELGRLCRGAAEVKRRKQRKPRMTLSGDQQSSRIPQRMSEDGASGRGVEKDKRPSRKYI